MQVRAALTALALLPLAACDTALGTQIARDQAKTAVDEVVETRYPGVDPTPVTDCIIDNAGGSEIVELGTAAVTGVTDSTVTLVLEIATRPDTIACLADRVGPLVLTRIIAASTS